jgi:Uncharacterized protein conserved in bacteria (DUF2064)
MGTDVPDLTADVILAAAQQLQENDICLGPAEDGGYYLVGMKDPHEGLFQGIQWSTSTVYTCTVAAATRLGLKLPAEGTLPKLRDMDVLEVCADFSSFWMCRLLRSLESTVHSCWATRVRVQDLRMWVEHQQGDTGHPMWKPATAVIQEWPREESGQAAIT